MKIEFSTNDSNRILLMLTFWDVLENKSYIDSVTLENYAWLLDEILDNILVLEEIKHETGEEILITHQKIIDLLKQMGRIK